MSNVTEMKDDMLNAIGEVESEVSETFSVKDLMSADWALGKIRHHEMNMSARAALAKEQIKRINEWVERENRSDQNFVDYMATVLEPFAKAQLQDEKKKRSVSLPNGKVGFRKAGGGLNVIDEAAAIAWAKENCKEAIKIKESILKKPLTTLMKEKGELADGCEPVPERDNFYVDVS